MIPTPIFNYLLSKSRKNQRREEIKQSGLEEKVFGNVCLGASILGVVAFTVYETIFNENFDHVCYNIGRVLSG